MQVSKRSRILLASLALMFAAGTALADDPVTFPECAKAPSPDDVESAKQSHIIATSRFNLQDWDKAIEFWRQAYAFDCTAHGILQNIANAYEKKGDKKNAIVALETYLVRAKDAPDLVKVNERVLDLKKSLEPVPTATATATATATVTATATATVAVPPTGPRPYGSIPFIVAGVGGALAIAGAIMIPVGLGPYNDSLEKCQPNAAGERKCPTEIANAGNTGRVTWNMGAAFLGIGVVAAAGGIGFHFLFNQPKPIAASATPEGGAAPASSGAPSATPNAAPAPTPRARMDVVPVVGPQFGGLVLTGKF